MKIILITLACIVPILLQGCGQAKDQNLIALNRFIEDLSLAEEFTLWDPFIEEEHRVTNKTTRIQLVEWLRAQSVEYDEEDTMLRREGGACGCAPVIVGISPTNRASIHIHNLILYDEKISYRPKSEGLLIHYPLYLAGILKEGVSMTLSHDKAVLLAMMLHEMLENEDLSYGEQDAIEHALRELPDILTDQILEDYEGFRKRTEEKASKYYW